MSPWEEPLRSISFPYKCPAWGLQPLPPLLSPLPWSSARLPLATASELLLELSMSPSGPALGDTWPRASSACAILIGTLFPGSLTFHCSSPALHFLETESLQTFPSGACSSFPGDQQVSPLLPFWVSLRLLSAGFTGNSAPKLSCSD